ncbi:hypothetical protein IWQ60_012600, partial [Tieghemiomyces parasiticus]
AGQAVPGNGTPSQPKLHDAPGTLPDTGHGGGIPSHADASQVHATPAASQNHPGRHGSAKRGLVSKLTDLI